MATPQEILIADRYAVRVAQPQQEFGGGLPCFAARDSHSGDTALIAIQVRRDAPARARPLQTLVHGIEGLLTPLAHGIAPAPRGEAGYFVICPAPPGPPLAGRLHPWPEAALIAFALRPIALALEKLAGHNLTHRAIRPNNVFQGQPGQPLVLGAAWAAPPAMHQPALFEPPYSAMCHPAGRGDGSIADDVYALGVLLLTLALGRLPLPDLDEAGVLRRKLELGSLAALIGDERLSPLISDLLRGMLAEDPEHRPTPALLLDPAVARSRRVAARPPRHAQRALAVGGVGVSDARTLAYALAIEPEQGITALRSGTVVGWLRRGVGDAALATHIDDVVRHRMSDAVTDEGHPDAAMLMLAIAVIDPLAPLCWRGVALWPDGLGPLLAAAGDPALARSLEEMIATEAVASWAMLRTERCDLAVLRLEARQNRAWLATRGPAGGLPRLAYLLNPLLPCASALLAGRWVNRLTELPTAIEAAIVANPNTAPLDAHLVAFIAARGDSRVESETNAMTGATQNGLALSELRLLTQLQVRYYPRPLPALAAWIAGAAGPIVALWCNRPRRQELTEQLKALAPAGQLLPILALLEDPAGRSADAAGARAAAAELNRVEAALAGIAASAAERRRAATRLGQEIAAGVGLLALATMLALAVVG
ncbi:MAG TPA: serine/threonine-protein kinase [Acetobacteraceae bacterium]|nr:serine/threonine-protein kinase [Acetobacteraceae bacterium]